MYTEQQKTNNTHVNEPHGVISERTTTSEESDFPQEQITFDSTPFDDELFVTIEYDVSDNPSDPLAVEQSDVVPPPDTQNIKISHPLFHRVQELPEPYLSPGSDPYQSTSPESLYPCTPPKITRSETSAELQNLEKRGAAVIQDSGKEAFEAFRESMAHRLRELAKGERIPGQMSRVNSEGQSSSDIQQETTVTPRKAVENRSDLLQCLQKQDQLGGAARTEDESSEDVLMEVLSGQMLEKIEEKKRALDELRKKRNAEAGFAKLLVRQMMKPGSRLFQNARRSDVSHRAVSNAGVRVDSCSTNQGFDQMTAKQRRNAEGVLVRRLLQHMSNGLSLKQTIQELQSSIPLMVADCVSRGKQENVGGNPIETRETAPRNTQRTVTEKSEHAYAKWKRRSSVEGSHAAQVPTSWPASSITLGAPQPPLPSYSAAFRNYSRASTSLAGHPAPSDKRLPAPVAFQPPPSRHIPTPKACSVIQRPQSADRLKLCLPQSAVHPAHLLPPTSRVASVGDELDNLIETEITNWEQTNPHEHQSFASFQPPSYVNSFPMQSVESLHFPESEDPYNPIAAPRFGPVTTGHRVKPPEVAHSPDNFHPQHDGQQQHGFVSTCNPSSGLP